MDSQVQSRMLADVRAAPDPGAERVTQALAGEAVVVVGTHGEWSQVVLPWQPSRKDERGYPGWMLTEALWDQEPLRPMKAVGMTHLSLARLFTGTPYLWGGLSGTGIDCSGLVHIPARALGVTVPRDASDQQQAFEPVELTAVQTGDLYFFATDGRVDHVAIATASAADDPDLPILHADGTHGVVAEPMPPDRRDHLYGAAKLPWLG